MNDNSNSKKGKVNVKGTFKKNQRFWDKKRANISIIEIIKTGYKNWLIKSRFVTESVLTLPNTGRIKETKVTSFEKNSENKPKPILDLRYVNQNIP